MKVHSGKGKGQMSAVCQLESLVMTFTWPVTEAVLSKTADRIGPPMADHEHTYGSRLLLPCKHVCCTFSSKMGCLSLAAAITSGDLKIRAKIP